MSIEDALHHSRTAAWWNQKVLAAAVELKSEMYAIGSLGPGAIEDLQTVR
jgi:hypothetical protein